LFFWWFSIEAPKMFASSGGQNVAWVAGEL
jgi:hypothetical protein